MLRKSKKPVVLVVNKIDNLKDEANMYEFYNLGIGDPKYYISITRFRTWRYAR